MSVLRRGNPWGLGESGAAWLFMVAVVLWIVLPLAPNYDTATHLVWAHEIAAGRMPGIEDAAAPTLHPLWLLLAIPADQSSFGPGLFQLLTVFSWTIVIASAWLLASRIAGPVAGVLAAVATGSSFALMLLAFKAYVDLPFLALVLTALVIEWSAEGRPGDVGDADAESDAAVGADAASGVDRPSGRPITRQEGRSTQMEPLVVPVILFAAGLLRPEAWAFGVLFVALRALRDGDGAMRWPDATALRAQLVPALVVLAAPVLWILTELLLTGDPLHSLTGTQALAEELGRPTGLATAPKELAVLLSDLARPPVAAAGLLGVGLVIWLRGWRALLLPLVVLAAGCAGFILVGALGLPLLQRYLLVPAVLVCVFAGVAGGVLVAWARGRRDPGGELATAGFEQADVAPQPAAQEHFHGKEGVPDRTSVPAALRLGAAAALAVGALGVAGYLAIKADSFRIVAQGVLREAQWQRQGAELLDNSRVINARCGGPITLPTYRFIPELTLRAGRDEGDIVSRATALGGAGPQTTGIAIVIEGSRAAKVRLGWAAGVPRSTNEIPPGFTEVARRGPFVATARCG